MTHDRALSIFAYLVLEYSAKKSLIKLANSIPAVGTCVVVIPYGIGAEHVSGNAVPICMVYCTDMHPQLQLEPLKFVVHIGPSFPSFWQVHYWRPKSRLQLSGLWVADRKIKRIKRCYCGRLACASMK